MEKLLIANRGEIAIRIARAAADMGLRTVAIHSEDDAASLHVRAADEVVRLRGSGAAAYLDMAQVIGAAQACGANAIHPGYGFLSERADFARACNQAHLVFIGPQTEHLELFGDKARARQAATAAGVPVIRGIDSACSLDDACAFFASLGAEPAMIIKALAGGGGRGTRVVRSASEIEEAFARCRSESLAAFGRDELYVEELIPRARHIEVQILGDRQGRVTHLGERECSVQRRFQKLLEIAPAPALDPDLRGQIIDAALRLARSVGYTNLGTFEFLVDVSGRPGAQPFAFIEANARLQVEHTVTEAVTGVDLVQAQIRLARGASLAALGLDTVAPRALRGFAIQARVNLEYLGADGSIRPGAGTLTAYEPPGGPGLRTDGFGYAGYTTSSAFDSLLAKVIAHCDAPTVDAAAARLVRALGEFRIEGVATNIGLLRTILRHPDLVAGRVHTRWLDEHLVSFAQQAEDRSREAQAVALAAQASRDPLALFAHRKSVDDRPLSGGSPPAGTLLERDADGTLAVPAPMQGTLVAIQVQVGDEVLQGQPVAVVEAMKMEHVVCAPQAGVVSRIGSHTGVVVREGFPLLYVRAAEVTGAAVYATAEVDLDRIRPDLQESIDRHALTQDAMRPDAVARRRRDGHRMPRENIARLVDPGSFDEYGALVVARQHQRRDLEQLRLQTPADGVITGMARINGDRFDDTRSRAVVVHYDYTVLAGTQGRRNHEKQDRIFELAHRFRLPVVLFGEGGGGRPGDDDVGPRVAIDTKTFTTYSQLSGLVPLVAVVNGRCFAGNTALVACSDVIIATKGSTLGMGGPAMIEGGGLGIYTPDEVGPMSFQVPNGVVDILVLDEDEAVDTAKKYLSYFQGPVVDWEAHDQRRLRAVVPENRLRLYDMREVLATIADKDSVLEIRRHFGVGIITAFARVEGRPIGVIASNPQHLGGAIDSDGADKGARFLQLCDAFDIPVLSLVDCPGMMVGPDVERTALVRHCARMFNVGANLTTPLFSVVVRKAYGLGAQALLGASSLIGFFSIAWPTAEFAPMNIEGAVKLGFRRELAAIEDPEARVAEFERRTAHAQELAKAVNSVMGGGIDDVIDPAETRRWIVNGLRRLPSVPERTQKKHPCVPTW